MTKTWWTMEDLEYETNRRRPWLKANILEVPKFRKEIEQFAHYPINSNDQYRFVGSKMKQFLEDNFKTIFG
ncbi:DUF771 domain-containing protein [Staphylococcus pasteuri]|uniref:DUF771 domain-containing protein n=1 Tax=Staphylococcus pasteuri TaxID=45972 RepID=UPI000E392E25|nr:DUF771 domain-containing protein [Staphylococcus pasteuri]RFD69580.1 hypothetical protein A7974_03690 [Staphylococcus pasteuri]